MDSWIATRPSALMDSASGSPSRDSAPHGACRPGGAVNGEAALICLRRSASRQSTESPSRLGHLITKITGPRQAFHYSDPFRGTTAGGSC